MALAGDALLVECTPASGILVIGQGYQHGYHVEQGVSRATIPLDGLDGSPRLRVIVIGSDGKRPGPTLIGCSPVGRGPAWRTGPLPSVFPATSVALRWSDPRPVRHAG
ncbi:hypothetical protein NBRC116599_22700 [Aquicoccus sp. SU-CL01552]